MTVQHLMDICKINKVGFAIEYIKEGLRKIQINNIENIVETSIDIVSGVEDYNFPSDMERLVSIDIISNPDNDNYVIDWNKYLWYDHGRTFKLLKLDNNNLYNTPDSTHISGIRITYASTGPKFVYDPDGDSTYYTTGGKTSGAEILVPDLTDLLNTIIFISDNVYAKNGLRGHYYKRTAYNKITDSTNLTSGDLYMVSSTETDGNFNPYSVNGELMPNQEDRDFSSPSAWGQGTMNSYNEHIDLSISASAASQYCTLPVASAPTTNGTKYTLQFTVSNLVSTWTIKSFDGTQTIGTVTSNGTKYISFTASTTGGLRIVSDDEFSVGDFDDFSLKESLAVGDLIVLTGSPTLSYLESLERIGTPITSGNLTIGVTYIITGISLLDFTADGASSNALYTVFTATDDTLTLTSADNVVALPTWESINFLDTDLWTDASEQTSPDENSYINIDEHFNQALIEFVKSKVTDDVQLSEYRDRKYNQNVSVAKKRKEAIPKPRIPSKIYSLR